VRNMLSALLVLATTVSLFAIAQAGVYKYIDENGQVAYGDRPVAGAKKIKIRKAPRRSEGAVAKRPKGLLGSDSGYVSLEVLTPKHDKIISDRNGSVEVILTGATRLTQRRCPYCRRPGQGQNHVADNHLSRQTLLSLPAPTRSLLE